MGMEFPFIITRVKLILRQGQYNATSKPLKADCLCLLHGPENNYERKNSIMEHIFTIAALWLGLAIISAIIAYHLKVSIALIEICVEMLAAAVAGHCGKMEVLGFRFRMAAFLGSFGCRHAHISGRY
jgi:hypothetical protein